MIWCEKGMGSNLNLLFDILLLIPYYSILCGSYGRQNKLLFNEDSCVNFFSFSQQVEQRQTYLVLYLGNVLALCFSTYLMGLSYISFCSRSWVIFAVRLGV